MTPSNVLLLAFLIGCVTGSRTFTAPAAVAWGARTGSLNFRGSRLSFMASTAAVVIFTVMALFELVMDKRPSTPSRLGPPGLIGRVAFGGLSGACIATAGAQSVVLGAVLGGAGAVVGAIVGYTLRARLVRALEVPDFVIACLEDLVAIGGGLLIVSRF